MQSPTTNLGSANHSAGRLSSMRSAPRKVPLTVLKIVESTMMVSGIVLPRVRVRHG